MNHKQLHKLMSETLEKLGKKEITTAEAKEIFNGGGKLVNLCKCELVAINMGAQVEVPLLDIKQEDSKKMKGTISLPSA